ncbi:Probable C10 family peptidase, streptopain, precursor containing a T9SS type A C-terminal secretion signal [Tenacibaculum sp. 190524A02b]|uniref:C10 family peptidase n=1 Tax=Tenacibaculum vairaonense TaxID=3137860 RepID=UPI0032B17C36
MKTKITLLSMLFLLCFNNTFADPIGKKKALLVAGKWINKAQQKNAKTASKKVVSIDEIQYKETLVYYVINYNNGGFVIVSADDSTKPILAYSDTGLFDQNLDNPTTKDLLNAYKSFVYESAQAQKASNKQAPNIGWNKILNPAKKRDQKRETIVAPFMDDILYTQSSGFNRFCPSDEDGQAIVGCVATAMSQVMRYWEFPTTGNSETSYNHRKYGNLSVNFAQQNYDWDNMSKTRADDENAKLSYHAGVAVRMNYGTSANGGSGAYTRDALSALKRNFKYNQGASMKYRYYYSDQDWYDLIKSQLDLKRPVLYSGRSKNLKDPDAGGAGHLFALDGYDSTDQGDFFHINWGWAGRSNGYFYLTEMITHGGKYNWIDNNAIMVDLYPTNLAPQFNTKASELTKVDEAYTYTFKVTDENRKDKVNVTLKQAPSWLTLNTTNGAYTLQGTPASINAGTHTIVIEATDGTNTTKNEFILTVLKDETYCSSKGNRIKYEWIDYVAFGDMTNSTGENGGYADFTDKVATVVSGTTNKLTVSAGFSGSTYPEHFAVWIDFNQNEIFEENEKVVTDFTNNGDNKTNDVLIPVEALLGTTKMRVSMKYKDAQTPCESFADGEVEDYVVNIVQTAARPNKKTTNNKNSIVEDQIKFSIFPNPTTNFIQVKAPTSLKNALYEVIDVNGRIIVRKEYTNTISVENLQSGMYYLRIFNDRNEYLKPFIKSVK